MAIFYDSRSDELKIRCDGCGKTETVDQHQTDHTLAHPWVREHGWKTMLRDKHWINICEKCKIALEDEERDKWKQQINPIKRTDSEQAAYMEGYRTAHNERAQISVTKIIEEVIEDICNKYCKYPDIWDEEKEGCELSESEICDNCPLNRLG